MKNTKNKSLKLPDEMLPRERIIKYGPSSLSDYELLAIMLRTGTKGVSVLELAKEVLEKIQRIHY